MYQVWITRPMVQITHTAMMQITMMLACGLETLMPMSTTLVHDDVLAFIIERPLRNILFLLFISRVELQISKLCSPNPSIDVSHLPKLLV